MDYFAGSDADQLTGSKTAKTFFQVKSSVNSWRSSIAASAGDARRSLDAPMPAIGTDGRVVGWSVGQCSATCQPGSVGPANRLFANENVEKCLRDRINKTSGWSGRHVSHASLDCRSASTIAAYVFFV